MKKTALSLAISILLFSTSSIVLSNDVINTGESQNESARKFKKRINLKRLNLTKDNIKKIGKKELAELEPAIMRFFDTETIKDLSSEAFEGLNVEQLTEIDAEGLKGLTAEQFDKIPSEILKALDADDLNDLDDDIFEALSLDDVEALDEYLFKKANTQDLSKLLVSIGKKHKDKGAGKKVHPADLRRFLPEGWEIADNGELIVPEGTDLALPAMLNSRQLLTGVKFPRISNLKKGFGMNGAGNSFLGGMNGALRQAGFGQYIIEQDDEGILHVKGDDGIDLAFMPDDNQLRQAGKGKVAGLLQNKRGFFVLTTEEGREVTILPAPKNLTGIQGLKEVELGASGDVTMKLDDEENSVTVVGLFDPILTTADTELTAGVHFPEDESGREPATIVYEDGSAQQMYPTIPKIEAFIKEAKKIEGVESVELNSDGTLAVQFKGAQYQLEPTFNVTETKLASDETIEPSIELNPNGTINYNVQNEQAVLTIPLNLKESN
ncbi:MAG: hypothetical protein KAU26_08125 [Methylococcales bacterium]|nr:hypothetical protein [Methylococcales bacterium]